jgi:hypothetical protein
MEGGVALFLLLIILVVAAIAGIALYLLGGALTLKSDAEKEEVPEPRPEHERPTNQTEEKVVFAGTRQDDERSDN